MKPAVEAFSRAYEKATADKQAALRAWMRNIILPGIACAKPLKELVAAAINPLVPDKHC